MTSKHAELRKLRKTLAELEGIRGRHTELVSVYVPAGYDINKIIQHLAQEQGTASNIKDARTRNNVIDSLERAIRYLRNYNQTPPNGIAVFAGNASEADNKIIINVWGIEPPEPINFRIYRCDQTFLTHPLHEMLEHKIVYGLIVLDRREATIGLLKGTKVLPLATITSGVPGKTKAGGQCYNPESFVLLSNGEEKKLKEVGIGDVLESYDILNDEFFTGVVTDTWESKKSPVYLINGKYKCSKDHLFLTNRTIWKAAEELVIGDALLNDKGRSERVIDISITHTPEIFVDITMTTRNFLADGVVIHNSAQRFERLREGAAKEFYKRISELANQHFLDMKTELKGILIGGPIPTKEEFHEGKYLNEELRRKVIALKDMGDTSETGLKDLVDRSQEILAKEIITEEKQIMEKFFETLARTPDKAAYGKNQVEHALELSAVDTLLLSESLGDETIDIIAEKGEATGADVKVISTDTQEGVQLKDLGGYGAILRYSVTY